jgi:hypothetical protein
LGGSENQSKTLSYMFVRFYQRELEIHEREKNPKSGTAARFSGYVSLNLLHIRRENLQESNVLDFGESGNFMPFCNPLAFKNFVSGRNPQKTASR